MIKLAKNNLKTIIDSILNENLVTNITLCTLILNIFYFCGHIDIWWIGGIIATLSIIGLFNRKIITSPYYWGGFTIINILYLTMAWATSDNHHFLLTYWFLLLTLVHMLPDEKKALCLAKNAKWMMTLVMLFAVFQKAIYPEYLSGTFFLFEFLYDHRFTWIGNLLNIDLYSVVEKNRQLADYMKSTTLTVQFISGHDLLPILAKTFAWIVILFEFIIGFLFLLPNNNYTYYLKHAALLFFCLSIYTFVPVFGFCFILLLIGISQVNSESKTLQSAYYLTMLYTLFNSFIPYAYFPVIKIL